MATPTRTVERIRVAIVYTRSRNDDPDLYLRAGFYHQMRLEGYYRGDGTLDVLEFPLQVEPTPPMRSWTPSSSGRRPSWEQASFRSADHRRGRWRSRRDLHRATAEHHRFNRNPRFFS